MSQTESAENSMVWTALVVLIAGCVTGSTITAMLRDARHGYGFDRRDRQVVFSLSPRAAHRGVQKATPRSQPRPLHAAVPPLEQFLPAHPPAPVQPAPAVTQQFPSLDAPADNTSVAVPPPRANPRQQQPSSASASPDFDSVAKPPIIAPGASELTDATPKATAEQIMQDVADAAQRQLSPVSSRETDVAIELPPVPPVSLPPQGVVAEQQPTVAKHPWPALPELSPDQQLSVRAAIGRVEARIESLVAAGMEAGRRNAPFTARDKMLDALRMLAQTADAAAGVTLRTEQLKRGITAIEESAAFARNTDVFDSGLSPARVVAKHRSQIVSPEEAASMTHLALQRVYLEFGQESLAAAAADSPAGSQALVGIAKFYLVRAATDGMKREGPRAVALCQAAMVVDPNNFSAANELGALLAQYGRLEDAKQMLLTSLRSQPTVAAWHNLSVVHQRLGETDLAELARQELEALQAQEGMNARNVGWVDKDAFARTNPGPGADRAAFNTHAAPSQTAPPTQAHSITNNRWIR